ncbi:probable E3 ubiquitin-protein ligase XERICO isoform X2 [Salvia miltiorrhiza]|uniref:probable E3 ubiquitin-protein ligase XERICO isoform X2 n=1 Tax=Salvia miltiorrhiza TaxID=226208 RepID=UPI0025AC8959|nr:probable E3 ubiquitin-protein ligase XERICO isoform X2 [Salvia miltiorrhiza]XP_057796765.1 probable E3 ubiquitin-protein ligase XERICO isoform X2 [Salvia miltiorrhiza]XP_057796766.1 probable E3 ubiquitin-protein ligase XERICO isoform X2 [Salvia miltiorrhiza]XP_057796767.1 probable E3 ubiquitin-protein ligase XERICO isoform X2 [Salvia miltiorrhiza]
MAISSYPIGADAGVLCIILANTAISISIVKEIVRSILHVMGIRIASWEELSADPSASGEYRKGLPESYMEEFRSQIPAMRFDSLSMHEHDYPGQECSICLSEFEPNAAVNHLTCGHVFHNLCLEKWLNYWNTTCPLCRNSMMPQDVEDDDTCPMM